MKLLEQFRWQKINQVFSIVMVLDRDLRIITASHVLRGHLPQTGENKLLHEVFDAVRPRNVTTIEHIIENPHSLFLYISKDKKFAIRGQIIADDTEDSDWVVFMGSPWLSWLTANRPELTLGIRDFSAQDAQLDQLFYMTTEKTMIQDLEDMNRSLEKANREVKEVQSEKDAFFAQMSHEMRTPLNGVISALSLLQEENMSARAKDLLHLAVESSRNMLEVVNYVLDVSKLESKANTFDHIDFNLASLVHSVVDVVKAKAELKKLPVDVEIESALYDNYTGAAQSIRQCLLNLLINAIKFTDRGMIRIRVLPDETHEDHVRFEVVDTGIGISEQEKSRIFEPFVSLGMDRDRLDKGSGLGLDIVRRNVESMSGNLGVDSMLGIGSKFWFAVPLTQGSAVHADLAQAVDELDSESDTQIVSGAVMLVDDNETNLLLGSMILEAMGAEVITATSGENALRKLDDLIIGKPDLVLMDISMPGLDGFETTEIIRKSFTTAQLPVFALTAYASSKEKKRSELCGMNGYLVKPINRDELYKTLRSVLPASHPQMFSSRVELTDTTKVVVTNEIHEELDQSVLDILKKQIGEEALGRVIRQFLKESDTNLEEMLKFHDHESVRKQAHSLKGTCNSLGLMSLGELLSEIEDRARAGDALASIDAMAEELPSRFATVKRLFHQYLNSH